MSEGRAMPCDYCGGELTGDEELIDARHLFPADSGEVVCSKCIARIAADYPASE